MKVITETSLYNFEAGGGAINTKERIVNEGKAEDFAQLIEELYPDGLTDIELNDLLWFEDKWIYETLGIEEE